ncbi:g2068 [Coccomyxa viridis]|uniref:Nitrate reductase n=1 Tax=Coccomyxa viridis TaxID=1274662 RepID=A0ABP1FJH2_9CHLO
MAPAYLLSDSAGDINGLVPKKVDTTYVVTGIRSDGAPEECTLEPQTQEWRTHEPVTDIDPRDAATPDAWVPRHPDLIRLTGRHPFNVEPPPNVLMKHGFVTPASLHYVRNHGPVPRINWSEHRLRINGLVSKPMEFSMDQLLSQFEHVNVLCTLTCAGNRRKEENMVAKTIGFNWGPAGTSCSQWTGIRLADVLQHCGMQGPENKANYVCFRGPKHELPQGDDGSYGTSIERYKALDSASDIILAFKQNGRLLTPDHGYPLRIIIPGYIGGRMVKWLEEITVTEGESDNFYHFHDNRVLPSHVTEQLAKSEGWWYKPDFIINDININSAVTSPAHDEVITLAEGNSHVSIAGYAYSGAGRKIIRCEVSLDGAKSWQLAEIRRACAPNAFGKHWAWVHWELRVPILGLLRAEEIVCRAWDEAMNTQPDTFTWNLMGMLNNCHYRVKVHAIETKGNGIALQFEHPTIAGTTVGGWMNRADKIPVHAPEPPIKDPAQDDASKADALRIYSMEDVEKHDTRDSAWFVHKGQVYDATSFLKEHPGGGDSILLVAGTDATEEFDAIHSEKAKKQLLSFAIGRLATTPIAEAGKPPTIPAVPVSVTIPIALNPKKKLKFKLAEKHQLSHNVRRYRFALPSVQHKFGLPVGKHVFLYAKVNDELVMRAYTPTSSDDELGYFDLVIKVYWKNEHPRFPDGGKMSQYLESLPIGGEMEVKGPLGHFHYLGRSRYTLDGAPHTAKHISMIAGGTGITPMYQVIKAVLKQADDDTQLSLLYANQSPDDILLFEELQEMAKDARFKVWYTVDRVPEGMEWSYSTGFVSEDMVQEHLFPHAENTIAVMCGPPPMIKFACLPNLAKQGYPEAACINF